jgi:hypothetical protein
VTIPAVSIDLKSVVQRVQQTDLFLTVTDSVDMAEATESFHVNPPAAFVYTSSETAQPNQLVTGFRQRIIQNVGILFVLAAERADQERTDPMEERRVALLSYLANWKPDGSDKPLEYVSFRPVFSGEGMTWAEAIFSGSYHITNV